MVQRSGRLAGLALAISCAALAAAARAAPAADQSLAAGSSDPAVRAGQLANGMRYIILRHAAPPGQSAIWLRIGAGSLMERKGEAGAAHFIEHLAFDGSKGIPSGEMAKMLRRADLTFAADSNGAADYEATTYRFDLPKTDDATVDTALRLLRETGGELILSPTMISLERGALANEARQADLPANRLFEARLAFLVKDQIAPGQSPFSRPAAIEALKRGELEAFYHRYYRPERAVLIAVGDFDPDRMEALIRARFSAWRGVGPAGGEPDIGRVTPRAAEARLSVEPGAPTSLQISFVAPPDISPDSVDRRRGEMIERIAMAVLNARLDALASSDAPPFLNAAAFRVDEFHAARVTSLLVTAEPEQWRTALAAASLEQRRLLASGINAEELTRATAQMDSDLRDAVSSADRRDSSALAAELESCVATHQACPSPAQDLALFEETVKSLTPDIASAALRSAFQGGGPLLFMTSPTPIEGGEAAVQAALLKSLAEPIPAA